MIYNVGTAIDIAVRPKDKNGNAIALTSITILIKDPAAAVKVNGVAMTAVGDDNKYEYVYQSSPSDLVGDYTVTITAVYQGFTAISSGPLFTLKAQAGF
jgi:hypothetical protein